MDGIKHDTPDVEENFFNAAMPDLKSIQDHPASLQEIQKIEETRAFSHKEYEAECEMHRATWIEEKASEIFDRHHGEHRLDHPKPDWAPSVTWQDCVQQATDAVDARIKATTQFIDHKARTDQQKVIERVSFAREVLDKEAKEIHQADNSKRIELARDFDAHKSHYVAIARKNGSEHPERDAYLEYKGKLKELTSQKDHQLQQSYQKHGFNYHNEQYALSKRFNMSM